MGLGARCSHGEMGAGSVSKDSEREMWESQVSELGANAKSVARTVTGPLTAMCVPRARCGCEGQRRMSLSCDSHHLGFLHKVEQVRGGGGGERDRKRKRTVREGKKRAGDRVGETNEIDGMCKR